MQEKTLDEITAEVKDMLPAMNVNVPDTIQHQEKTELIADQQLLGIYDEILNDLRSDRQQVSELLSNFIELVINQGDASTSSKEALVNLAKIQSDIADKKSKIADQMTRVKMKDTNTYKPYMTAKQDNKTTINITGTKRNLLQAISKIAKDKGDGNE